MNSPHVGQRRAGSRTSSGQDRARWTNHRWEMRTPRCRLGAAGNTVDVVGRDGWEVVDGRFWVKDLFVILADDKAATAAPNRAFSAPFYTFLYPYLARVLQVKHRTHSLRSNRWLFRSFTSSDAALSLRGSRLPISHGPCVAPLPRKLFFRPPFTSHQSESLRATPPLLPSQPVAVTSPAPEIKGQTVGNLVALPRRHRHTRNTTQQ